MRTITLKDGQELPVLGQGTWKMGFRRFRRGREVTALRLGIDLGLTCIDTAESYAEGRAEEVVAEASAGRRDRVFLVTKVNGAGARGSGWRKRVRRVCDGCAWT